MSLYRLFAPVCLLAALCLPTLSYAQPGQQPQELEVSQQPEKQPTAPAPPASTREPLPSRRPTVTFHNGELSIIAENATLRDILEMVRSQTGATIDIPPGANELVFVRLGPGPVHQVLVSLLAGSDFNFIMLNSDRDPNELAKVVLSPKDPKASTTGEQESSQNAGQSAPTGIGSLVVRRRPGA
jgi:hypothetical protein